MNFLRIKNYLKLFIVLGCAGIYLNACQEINKEVEDNHALKIPFKEGYLKVNDDVDLFYRIVGNAPDTLVVLHGGPGFHMNYLEPDLRPLALSHTLLFYDQRAAGRSTLIRDTAKLRIANYIKDLETIREHFQLSKLQLLGHSWGAHLAARYAIAHPDRVKSIVMVDPGPPPAYKPYFEDFNPFDHLDSTSTRKAFEATEKWGNTPDSTRRCWEFYSQFIKAFLADTIYATQTWGDICNAPQEAMLNPGSAHVISAMGKNYDITSELKKIDQPVLIIYGSEDPVPITGVKQWQQSLSNSELAIVDGSGHFPFFEKPDAFFPLVEQFLNHPNKNPALKASIQWPPEPDTFEDGYSKTWWQISQNQNQLEQAVLSKDMSMATQMYTRDATIFAPGAPPIMGKSQIRAFYYDVFEHVGKASFQTLSLEGDENKLMETGRYTLFDKNGKVYDLGKYLVIWRSVKGQWKIEQDFINSAL